MTQVRHWREYQAGNNHDFTAHLWVLLYSQNFGQKLHGALIKGLDAVRQDINRHDVKTKGGCTHLTTDVGMTGKAGTADFGCADQSRCEI